MGKKTLSTATPTSHLPVAVNGMGYVTCIIVGMIAVICRVCVHLYTVRGFPVVNSYLFYTPVGVQARTTRI